jgi:hypothetical protein
LMTYMVRKLTTMTHSVKMNRTRKSSKSGNLKERIRKKTKKIMEKVKTMTKKCKTLVRKWLNDKSWESHQATRKWRLMSQNLSNQTC